jgi:GNAT superfamily N-acetyltransferase
MDVVRFVPLTPEEYRAFVEEQVAHYADEQVRAGNWGASGALTLARSQIQSLLPKGLETPDQFLRAIVDEASGLRVGTTWYALRRDWGSRQMFVYWLGIDPPYRRRGLAAQALERIGSEAKKAHADRIALNVFAQNLTAQSLYRKLGFQPVATMMAKPIPP